MVTQAEARTFGETILRGDANYCQRCATELVDKQIEGKTRGYCPSCGFVVYLDPKVAAAVLVSDGDRLVMVKRGVEPEMGRWAFPSGYVDRGEVVEHAAIREVKEETGLDIELDEFVGLYSQEGSAVILAVFSARTTGGVLQAGHDALETEWFATDNLPDLPFSHDQQILMDWRRQSS
jgi:8-oxo-dGTP diphosphatase